MSTDNTSSDMITDLSMLQLADSFFPTGMYTMSSGLEAIFYGGRKNNKMNAAELRDLIKVFLEQQIGPADCTALGNAYEHASASNLSLLLEVDNTIVAMRLVQEIRSASIRSGTQLVKCVHSFIQDNKMLADYADAIKDGRASGPYPVALGVAASALSIPKRKAGMMMLYSFSVSIIAAALRLGMLQHLDGQRILDELKPTISKTVESFIDRPLDGIWQFAPQIDIIQIEHERMSSKMFIT
ncbi:MAG TPA: urease accessory UreF family protein [Nitrososphaera sp.]|nr:urease accessory UreF family protein [uncultured Nitrososphaera sp.]